MGAKLRRLDAHLLAWLSRLPIRPEVLAWSMLALGLSIFLVGLGIYFWGPKESEVDQPPAQEESSQVATVEEAQPAQSAKSEPTQPEPTKPESAQPESAQPELAQPEPTQPEPRTAAASPPVDFGPALAADSEGPVLGKIHLEKPRVVPPRRGAVEHGEGTRSSKAEPSAIPASGSAAAAANSASSPPLSVAKAASAPAASEPEAKPTESAMDSLDSVYGADASGNGVPDNLDRWMTKTFQSKAILEVAQAYYQNVLPLATKAQMGVALTKSEKLSVLRATECYLITATQEGLRSPPNLNDRVLIQGGQAAERMKGLFSQVQAADYAVSGSRKKACE